MGMAKNLLHGIVAAAAVVGIPKLAYAAGAAAGVGGTVVEAGASFVMQLWGYMAIRCRADRNPLPGSLPAGVDPEPDAAKLDGVLRREFTEVANLTADEIGAEADKVIDEVAPHLPAEERAALRTYITSIPDHVRRTLRRADDPTGRTLPPGRTFFAAADLRDMLPARWPRFREGQSPIARRKLSRLLGMGTFGEVWLAEKPGINRPVALKFCTDSQFSIASLEHEARIVLDLEHDGIVQLLDVYTPEDGRPLCLEYEYVGGGDLCSLVTGKPADPRAAARLILELAKAVAFAHAFEYRDVSSGALRRGVVHRDLKPANILCDRRRGGVRLKITDWGIGGYSAAETIQQTRMHTSRGSSYTAAIVGAYTPIYASPQQIGGADPNPLDDVHALGVIWYQLALGDVSRTVGADAYRVLTRIGMPDEQIDLLIGCMAHELLDRPRDAGALVEKLERILADDASGAPAPVAKAPTKAPPAKPVVRPSAPTAPAKELTLDLGDDVSMELALIPAGKFTMGSPDSEAERSDDETQHPVRITRPFYMGKCAVTQAQWQAVMGDNPSHFTGDDRLPVEQVSWDDCKQFCEKLSQRLGREMRLPTEAEWEYACRAGTTTPFSFGGTISTDQANYNGNHVYGRGKKGEYRQKTTPVGTFPANAWGLYDMHGNVWEWCEDGYGAYPAGEQVDPTAPESSAGRVLRGGSWYSDPWDCRSANRLGNSPDFRLHNDGFRVVVASGT